MRRQFTIPILAVWAITLFVGGPAGATTVVPMSLADLSALSSDVVVGKVVYSKAIPAYNEAGQIVSVSREVRVAVERYFKSEMGVQVGSPYVTLYEHGGIVGQTDSRVIGVPEYNQGEKVFLFLRMDSRGSYRTLGLFQGKFSVRTTSAGTSEVVGKVGKTLADDLPIVSENGESKAVEIRMDLDQFETRVEGLIGLAERVGAMAPAGAVSVQK